MAARHLRHMSLSVAQASRTVRFLEAYANTGLQELDVVLQSTGVSKGEGRGDVLQREPAFTIAADAASALREAGQWLLYLDPGRARSLLSRSGNLFLELRQPFGAYLLEVAGGQQPPYEEMVWALDDLSHPGDVLESRWQALRHPQQQAYLMLAIAGGEAPPAAAERALHLLETSQYATGVVPVGALGTPIRRFWGIARYLLTGRVESRGGIAEHLAAMARRYEEAMALAQVNENLWRHAAAPVDVGDIDVSGIAALSARRLGAEALLEGLAGTGMSAERNPVGMAPIEAGLTLAEPWRDEPMADF